MSDPRSTIIRPSRSNPRRRRHGRKHKQMIVHARSNPSTNTILFTAGGIVAGVAVGWWLWKRHHTEVSSRVAALVNQAASTPAATPAAPATPVAPATPATAPAGQASDQSAEQQAVIDQIERRNRRQQLIAAAADPAFWGAWFRGHVGEEAIRRAALLTSAYGHHRAMIMIMQAIGDSLYGPGARW